MKNRIIGIFCVLLAVCLVFSACSAPAGSAEEQKPIQIALTQDMLSFDPMQTSDIFSEAVLRCLYTSLYDFDENLNLRSKLVKSEKILDDRSWQIEIHSGVKFHDGSPLTAEDVVFSIERARQGGRTQKLLEMVDSVEKVDDTNFVIRAKEPFPNMLSLFAKAETSIVSKKTVESAGYDFTQPVGAGPFKLISREEGSNVKLERFDDYFKEKAASKYLNFVVITTEQDRTAAFLNGDVDILFSVSAYDCDKLKLSPNVNMLQSPSTKIEYLSLNNNHAPLDDPKVRLAISSAIDREKIAQEVYHGYATPSSSLIPSGLPGYVDSPVTYDQERAKQLLKEAGMQDGFEFTVIAIDTIRKNTLEYIKLDLAEIGIKMNYNLITMKEAVDTMNAGEHDGILVGWAYSADPNSVLPLVLGTGSGKTMNSSNYSNPAVDELMASARKEANTDERAKLYEEINSIVSNDAPIVVLLNPMVLSAAQKNIDGVLINPQGLMQYESMYRK